MAHRLPDRAAALAKPIGLVNDLHYVCAPTPLQIGVARGLNEIAPEYYAGLSRDYEKKRDMIVKSLRVAGFEPYVPQGAYYLLADFGAFGWKNAATASNEILHTAKIASVPGTAFHVDPIGDTMVRFCFAKDLDVLEEACRRIEALKSVRPVKVAVSAAKKAKPAIKPAARRARR